FGSDLVPAVMAGVRAMIQNDDPTARIYELFWERFSALSELDRREHEHSFHPFYRERFPELAPLTSAMAAARPLLEYCFERGLAVVVATNPLFPETAIVQRLQWAGLDPAEFPFSLVTTYGN